MSGVTETFIDTVVGMQRSEILASAMARVSYELWPRKRLQLPFVPRSGHASALVMDDILEALAPRFGEQRGASADFRRRYPHLELIRIPEARFGLDVDSAIRERLEALLTEAAPRWRRYYEIRPRPIRAG